LKIYASKMTLMMSNLLKQNIFIADIDFIHFYFVNKWYKTVCDFIEFAYYHIVDSCGQIFISCFQFFNLQPLLSIVFPTAMNI